MTEAAPLEPDRVAGAPHPRETPTLIGQGAAEAAFLNAFNGGRMHHGWLLTGPRGIGKATLAWRIARFLLAQEPAGGLFGARPTPETLNIAPDHPVARRVAAMSEPRLKLLRRGWDDKAKRWRAVITVDETRELKNFFHLSAADDGHRIVIVDSADEMNPAAANALLKELEEPPRSAILLLISHQPARLLPTIRSRCRELRLHRLGAADMAAVLDGLGADDRGDAEALAQLAEGSVGTALRLVHLDGLALYHELLALAAQAPRGDRQRLIVWCESLAGRSAEARFDLALGLLDLLLARLARTGVTGAPPPPAGPDEAAILRRLAPDAAAGRLWAELAQGLGIRARQAAAVNLDPSALLLDIMLTFEETAARAAAR